jgi:pimeloyl-ACP methyl ester carboxylesterase
VLYAHGLMGSITSAVWAKVQTRLPSGAARHRVRRRGHGCSGWNTNRADYHRDALADDMHAVIEALGWNGRRCTGVDGVYGADAALNHPEAVSRLVLIVPPPMAKTCTGRADVRRLSVLYQAREPTWLARRCRRSVGPARTARRDVRHAALHRRAAGGGGRRRSGACSDRPQLPYERCGEIEHPALVLTHLTTPSTRCRGDPARAGCVARLAAARVGWWTSHPDELSHLVAAFVWMRPAGMPSAPSSSGRVRLELTYCIRPTLDA